MKINLGEVLTITKAINETSLLTKDLPAKTAYKLMKLVRVLNNEVETFEKIKTSLIEKFGKKKEDGTLDIDDKGTIALEDSDGFYSEFNTLIESEVEINDISISVDDFGDINIPTTALMALDKILS